MIPASFLENINSQLGKSRSAYVSIEVPISEELNLLNWLEHFGSSECFYWQNRSNNYKCAGIGISKEFIRLNNESRAVFFNRVLADLKNFSESDSVKAVGASSFYDSYKSDQQWYGFKTDNWYIPKVFIEVSQGIFRIQFERSIDNIERYLEKLFVCRPPNVIFPELINRADFPDKANWKNSIQSALENIEKHDLEKIVLARKSEFKFENEISPFSLLEIINDIKQYQYRFLFKLNSNATFIGVSPECLLRVSDSEISIDALGGTIASHPDLNGEGATRLRTVKNLREHEFVSKEVHSKLSRLAVTSIQSEEGGTLRLSNVLHIHTLYRAKLADKFTLGETIDTMHPTSAVGGIPANKAKLFLEQNEEINRGLYAGFIGVISDKFTELSVGIRSALVNKNIVSLFSGAGIVEGSDADDEWQELEAKIASFTKLFN